MNLAQLLVRAAQVYPDRPAVLLGDRPVHSYRALGEHVARLASHLRHGLGLASGDRVALYMGNHVEYLEVLYAAWWAGLAVVPINAKLHAREVEFILGDSGAALLFVSGDLAASLQPVLASSASPVRVLVPGSTEYQAALRAEPMTAEHRAPDELAWLFYTSGTTGRPKGVMLTHRNLYAMTACYYIDVDEVGADDAIVYAAPMSHGAGIYNFAFVAKAARHVVPPSAGFDPAELVALSKSVGRLCMFAAPTMVKRLVEHVAARGATAEGFKTIVYGGGPMYVEDIQQALAALGPRFVQIYGQGESPMTITALSREHLTDTAHPRWRERIASVGVAMSMVEVRVVDTDGATAARLLAQSRSQRQDAARRLVVDRRHGGDGRRRLPYVEGPLEGRDHQRRLEHLPARSRRSAAPSPWRTRGVGGRPARCRVGRSRCRLRRRRWRRRRIARRAVPGAHRALQAAQAVPLRRQPAQEQLRQGAEDRLARAVR
jgi:long-chain acyl-CoA synthetase